MRPTPQIEHSKARLLQRRHELLARYHQTLELSDEEATNRQIEQMDAATDEWDVRVLSHLSDVEAHELSVIVAALRRIAADTYGLCTECGQPIGLPRLEALPETPLCIDCADEAERAVG